MNEITPHRNIFAIESELSQVAEAFDTLSEGGTEETVLPVVLDYFGTLLEERDTKLDKYARYVTARQSRADYLKAEAALYQAEADRLKGLAATCENEVKSAKTLLMRFFQFVGIVKIETKTRKFSVCGNGGKAPLIVDDVIVFEKIDPCYKKVTVSLDTDAIRADLEDGIDVPFAKLGDRGHHIRIK